MKLSSEELRALYRRQTARSAVLQSQCPTTEMLVRASAGEVSKTEREQVVDHLMGCSDCADEYRLIRSLNPPAEHTAATSRADLGTEAKAAVAWHKTQAQLQAEERISASRPVWQQRLGAMFSTGRFRYAVVALLLALNLALGAALISLYEKTRRLTAQLNRQLAEQNRAAATSPPVATQRQLEENNRRAEPEEPGRRAEVPVQHATPEESPRRSAPYEKQIAKLRQTVNKISQPQINVPIVDLDPQGSTRGQSGGATAIEVPSSTNLFTLVLNLSGHPAHTGYALEIVNQHDKTVWRGRGLQKSPYDTFTVALPRRLFPSGQYRIRLYGLRDSQRELVEDYAVQIRYK